MSKTDSYCESNSGKKPFKINCKPKSALDPDEAQILFSLEKDELLFAVRELKCAVADGTVTVCHKIVFRMLVAMLIDDSKVDQSVMDLIDTLGIGSYIDD